ncbi:thiamine diphosphate-binding protein [Ochromonadaceae sp. CCMP2298]|nr:thiamine diphosphate-binding protein [Ochromonadaceae sp. CCMP2298]
MSAQELSTLIRLQANITIVLINNRTYTIEVQIHDGEYNKISEWRYADLVGVVGGGGAKRGDGGGNGDGGGGGSHNSAKGVRATTNGELQSALACSQTHTGVLLIECMVDKSDCTSALLEWGSRLATANMRSDGF